MSKYGNKKTYAGGAWHDSKKEAKRWMELEMLANAGFIKDLRRQVSFVLIPSQYGPSTTTKTGKIKRGKLEERAVTYIADFVYYDVEEDKTIVEDTKGVRTKDYIIKRKLMLWKYGIKIREI